MEMPRRPPDRGGYVTSHAHHTVLQEKPKRQALSDTASSATLTGSVLVNPDAALSREETWARRRRSWLIVAGAFSAITGTLGVVNAVGLLQTHLQDHQLNAYAPRDVGWITATNIFLALSVPCVAGPFFDRKGHRWILAGGTVCFVAGLLLMSHVDSAIAASSPPGAFAGLLGTWGLLCGAGAGLVATAVTASMNCWFERRRGIACGCAFMGSSVGGVVWALLLRDVLVRWGWGWALRTTAGLSAIMLLLGNVLMRMPPDQKTQRPGSRSSLSWHCLRQKDFVFMTLSLTIFQFVVMGVVGTLPSLGVEMGFGRNLMFNVVAMMNAGSAAGRVVAGALSDSIGRFNSAIVSQVLAFIVMFVVFLNVGTSVWRLYLFSPLWGFSSGATLSMMTVLISEVCEKDEFGMYFGTSSLIMSFAGLLCVPLSAQVLASYGARTHVIFFGILCIFSAVFLGLSRWAFLSWRWLWAVKA